MEEVHYINLDDIIPNRFQPREVFDDASLNELADSIREHGVIQPITVRPVGNKYEIICGERRYKASTLAGLTQIPALVKQMDDKESSIIAFIENCQRKNVSVIEEARTSERILKSNNMTQQELATSLGISQSALANKLRLLSLPQEIQDALMRNEISERHARSLLNVKDVREQLELLDEVKTKKMPVRELEALIKSRENNNELSVDNEGPISQNENSSIGESLNNMFIKDDGFNVQNDQVSEVKVDEAPNYPETQEDREFVSFLNNYDNEVLGNQFITPTPTVEPVTNIENTTDNFIDNNTSNYVEAPLNSDSVVNEDVQYADTSSNFEQPTYDNNYVNSFDSNNLENNFKDNNDFNDSAYINSDYVETPVQTFEPIDKIDQDYTVPSNNPMPKYIEEDSRFVDISKYNGLNSIDEMLKELKVVVDKIKSSKFKVDTEEVDFDDMYQITIKVSKNESFE